MRTVNVHEAKTHLSRLLEAVEAGEDVVIARAGTPVARLTTLAPAPTRRAGSWRGRVEIGADFDDADAAVGVGASFHAAATAASTNSRSLSPTDSLRVDCHGITTTRSTGC